MNKATILIGLLTSISLPLYASFECTEGMNELECKIFHETNRVRAQHGEKLLAVSPECTKAAIYHAESMEESGVYAHEIKGYKNFGERMNSFRVPGMRMAENIHHRVIAHFANLDEAAQVIVGDWYDSKGHRKNMMNSGFKGIGVAVVGDYQVQCFTDYIAPGSASAQDDQEAEGEKPSLKDFFGKIRISNPFKK